MFVFKADMLNLITNNFNVNKIQRSFAPQKSSMPGNSLKPLEKDTVSFTGARKFEGAGMAYAPSEKIAKQAHFNAGPAQFYLQTVFDTYLAPSISGKKSSKSGNTVEYRTRIKSANSIREKVAAKVIKYREEDVETISKQIADSFSEHFGLSKGVKQEYAQDSIKNAVSINSGIHAGYTPYTSVATFVDYAFDVSKKKHLYDIDKYSDKVQTIILADTVETIDNSDRALEAMERLNHSSQTLDGIKYYAYDIVGGKIVFNENDDEYAKKIVEGLKAAVQDNKLKIKSIENNIPDESKLPKGERASQYSYISESRLRDLAKMAGAKYTNNISKSGYMSVHINVDLTSDLFNPYKNKYNGYGGEIQIIGRDVNDLKKVEDLCYKFKDNKNVYHKAYTPFKEHFLKYYKGPVKKHFEDYTYALYLNQRKATGTRRDDVFPTIKELGFEGLVPEELDFNYLAQLKEQCDRNKAEMDREPEPDTESANEKDNQKNLAQKWKELQANAEIDCLKKFILYAMKKM